jgi:hypothetical protein
MTLFHDDCEDIFLDFLVGGGRLMSSVVGAVVGWPSPVRNWRTPATTTETCLLAVFG